MTTLTKREHRTFSLPWYRDLSDLPLPDRLWALLAGDVPLDRPVEGGVRLMRIEEFSEDGDTVIRAELPGIDPDKDIDISLDNDVLLLKASREERSEEKQPAGYRTEFRYGTLMRRLPVPDGISAADIHATYKDGILEIRVPTPSEPVAEAPQKIAVAHD